jgi:DNA-binding transcriptional LysR family regulator
MHIPWNDVQVVLAIADTGSLSAAARALRLTQPTVSRRLAELEGALGAPLFVRAVDGTTLTSLGERLIEPARRMAECAAEVDHAASDVDRRPRGVVRISAAPGMASAFVAPFAAFLRTKLPEVRLEVVSTPRYVDLVRREVDLAIRWQSTARKDTQKDLEVIMAVEHRVAGYATAEYAATLPRGYQLADVAWIGWCAPLDQLAPNPQLAAMIPGFTPGFSSDDYLIQLRAAELGAGAIVLSRFRYRLEPPTGLRELAIDLGAPPIKNHLVASRASLSIPRIRAVADLLAQELATTMHPTRGAPRLIPERARSTQARTSRSQSGYSQRRNR